MSTPTPWAVVTGASGGVGRSLVSTLLRDGWNVAAVGRDAGRLETHCPQAARRIVADVCDAAAAQAVWAQLAAEGITPVGLAHCVGSIRLAPIHRMKTEDFHSTLQANLVSAWHTLAAFVGTLREAKLSGAAVFVSSAAARIGTPNHEAVAAAKAGLEGLVRAAAASHAAAGIRINAVAPGLMDTPAASGLIASEAAREAAARQYPLAGIGNPADLAELMGWLLSERAARVTGEVWGMDGGFAAIRPLVR